MNPRPRRSLARNFINSSSPQSGKTLAARRHKPDYWLLVLTALLLCIGLVVVYSISPGLAASQHVSQGYFVSKQLIDVAVGLGAFVIAAYLPSQFWLKAAKPLLILALVGCLVVMATPIDSLYQAHRWIRFGTFSFQVAELVKLALVVWTAGFLAERWRRSQLTDFNATLKPLLIALLAIGVVVAKLQSDFGSAAVILAIIGLMAFAVGIPMKKIMLIGAGILILAVLAISTTTYRRERLSSFLHPQSHCQDTSYQACQALISVGSGGIFGLGLGYSVQAYGYLPEASNDSIFAIMAEKFGFIGTVSIVVLYGLFITRLLQIIERTTDQFNRLLVIGVLGWLSTQMIINMAAMLGLMPIKGITLPLISQGGTSLIFLTAALGIVFNISRYTNYNVSEPNTSLTEKTGGLHSFDGRGLRRPHNPSLVTRPRA